MKRCHVYKIVFYKNKIPFFKSDHLGENLDLLLKAVLSKLQGSETLSVMQVSV